MGFLGNRLVVNVLVDNMRKKELLQIIKPRKYVDVNNCYNPLFQTGNVFKKDKLLQYNMMNVDG